LLQLFDTLYIGKVVNQMFNLICEQCEEHFETNWSSAKFCGDYCRVKHWREQKKSQKTVHHSTCPNCWGSFAHKNPKKEFCSPKCKTAYHRRRQGELEKQDRYFDAHNYFAPPTPEEQIRETLERLYNSQQAEPDID